MTPAESMALTERDVRVNLLDRTIIYCALRRYFDEERARGNHKDADHAYQLLSRFGEDD